MSDVVDSIGVIVNVINRNARADRSAGTGIGHMRPDVGSHPFAGYLFIDCAVGEVPCHSLRAIAADGGLRYAKRLGFLFKILFYRCPHVALRRDPTGGPLLEDPRLCDTNQYACQRVALNE